MKKKESQDVSKYVYALASVVCVATIVIAVSIFDIPIFDNFYDSTDQQDEGVTKDETKETTQCTLRRTLDGICVQSKQDQQVPLVAVMIENHVEARPQSGLVDASVVYEAPVEANYSRFMALFPIENDVAKVGPVRSSRPYYLDWLQEYEKPLYMHVGGSPDALDNIVAANILSINEMKKGWFFWRDTAQYAPHNTYTSSQLWKAVYDDYSQKVTNTFVGWKFDDDQEACTQDCIHQIDITFLAPNYTATWVYNPESNEYERKQGKQFHTDLDGRLIVADTIIVQHVLSRVVDTVGRQEIDTIGSGQVEIYKNGFKIIGTWKKESQSGRTNWYDAQGNLISLKAGKIWIEVVNQRGLVTTE